MKDAKEMMGQNEYAMGQGGKSRTRVDVPSDKKITSFIKEAMKLNDEEVKLPERKKSTSLKEIEIPGALQKALNKNKTAAAALNNFSPSHKKEYVEWIN